MEFARENGFQASNIAAANLLDSAVTPRIWSLIEQRHDASFRILAELSRREPRTYLDDAIESLLAGEVSSAVRLFGKIHTERVSDFGKYRSIFRAGPDRSLAVWQVMNPFFLLWSVMPIARGEASVLWRSDQFNRAPDSDSGITAPWNNNEKILIRTIKDNLEEAFLKNSTILECGAGFGRNAKIFIEELFVDPSCYFGFDLHATRAEATRSIVGEYLEGSPSLGGMNDQIFDLDILSESGQNKIRALSSVDIIFYASFSCAFDDVEFAKMLRTISTLDPKYIIDVAATTSWGLSVGRMDPSEFYNDIGYVLRSHEFETPLLKPNESYKIWFPEKYWTNRIIYIYEKNSN